MADGRLKHARAKQTPVLTILQYVAVEKKSRMQKVQIKMEPSTSISQNVAQGPKIKKIHILSLNQDVIQAILSHLNYDEIAKLRIVS